jgi:Putative DNA-binding domain
VEELGWPPGASVLSLDGVESRVHSLTYYNYFIERQRPSPTRPRQLKWVRGSTFPNQENRWCELKEIKGANPIGSIKSVVDQYAVAYLNAGLSRAGAIFWGVRNEDLAIIGVNLSNRQCDELRRIVIEKLHQITPPLAPTAYEIYLHPVSDGGRYVPDLYLVEVRIPPARRTFLFSTGNQEVYVKTDAGRKKLSALEIQQELLKRLSIDPSF